MKILSLILLLLIILLIKFYFREINLKRKKKIKIKDVYRFAKTGDLILFKYHGYDSAFLRFLTGHSWTHMALVIEFEGKKYTLESHEKDDLKSIGIHTEGINMYPLKLRLKSYHGNVGIRFLNRKLKTANYHQLMQNIIKYIDSPFYTKVYSYYPTYCYAKKLLGSPLRHNKQLSDGFFCSEFIAVMLHKIRILLPNVETSCSNPQDFADNNLNTKLYHGYYYSKIYAIK